MKARVAPLPAPAAPLTRLCLRPGFLLVVLGWAITGMGAQSYGFVLLFADFLPTALPFARKVPVLGYVLSLPPVKHTLSKLAALGKGKGEDRLPT